MICKNIIGKEHKYTGKLIGTIERGNFSACFMSLPLIKMYFSCAKMLLQYKNKG
jgi:hypothetical protein